MNALGEGKITVYNVGTKANGEFEDIRGTAEAPNPAAPANLLVTFPIGKLLYLQQLLYMQLRQLTSWTHSPLVSCCM